MSATYVRKSLPLCRQSSHQPSFDREPRGLSLLGPTLLIAAKTNKMKIFEATISALACRLDVIPCGQVWDRREPVAFAILVMKSRKSHSGLANSASPALYLECFPLATVSVLRDFAQAITAPLQCLVDLAKSRSRLLSILLKWIPPGERLSQR
ncbi:hypothetical protein REMIM1_CH03234 [Rhizobium etli bv. mimosae str. Mim1]|nr:hypothetical protein REMIM1_CH03234 [Rhizobium etli bv. mimosae str. Mim1]